MKFITDSIFNIIKNKLPAILIIVLLTSLTLPLCAAKEFNKNSGSNISEKISNKKNYDILIIDSFHHGHSRNSNYIDKITDMFNNSNLPIEPHIIHLDTVRLGKNSYPVKYLNIFLDKYPKGFFDLIITLDNNALKILNKCEPLKRLQQAPLINLGATTTTKKLYPNSFNIPDKYYLKENIELIFKLFPQTKNIAVISSNKKLDKNRFSQIKSYINEKTNISAIYFNQDKISVNSILKKLNHLPRKTVIFIENLYNIKSFEYPNLNAPYSKIIRESPFPIFSNSEFVIKSGALGGIIQNFTPVIEIIKSVATTLLIKDSNTQHLSEYEINSVSTVFNWNSMFNYQAEYDKLPDNTIYLNRPQNSFGEPNKNNHILNILFHEKPPLVYTDKTGNIHGTLVKIWKYWSEKSNIPINFQKTDNLNSRQIKQLYHLNNYTINVGKSYIYSPETTNKSHNLFISTASIYHQNIQPAISNWKSLKEKKIAIVKNKSFNNYLRNQIPGVFIISYKNSKELINDIKTNKFDAFFMEDIVASYLLKEKGISTLFIHNNLCSSKIEISINPDNKHHQPKIIKELNNIIDSGMNKIPFKTIYDFFSPLLTNNIRSYPIFTETEKKFIASKNNLTTNCLQNWSGIESWNEGTATGVIPETLRLIMAELKISPEFISSNLHANKTTLLVNDNIDFISFASDSTQKNLLYTLPYLRLPAVTVSKNKNISINDKNIIIAIPSTYITYYYYLKKKFPHKTIILTESAEDTLKLISNNICDIAILSKITARNLMNKYKYKQLYSKELYNFNFDFSIGMLNTSENKILNNILNKIIITLPENKINEIISKYTYNNNNKITLENIIKYIIPTIIGITFFLLLLWGYTTKKALWKLNLSEQALQKEKSWLNATIHSIGEGMIATDVNGKIMQMNKVAEELINVKENEVIGEYTNNLFTLYNNNTAEELPDPVKAVLNNNETINFLQNITLINKSYNDIPITATATPIKESATDKLIGVVFIFKDVRAEEIYKRQLSQTKTLLSNAINLAGVTYFTYDLKNNKILLSSGKDESYLYVTEKTFNLKEIFLNVVENDMELINEYWHELLNGQIQRFTINYKIYINNELRYKRADILSENDSKGELARIFGVRLDITNAIEAEKEKQIAAERIEQAYNLAKLAYLEFLPTEERISFDEKVSDMFMLQETTAKNLSFNELFINVIPTDKEKFKKFLNSSSTGRIDNYEQEIQVKAGDTIKTLKVFATNSYNQLNIWTRGSGAVLDITELYYIQNELKASEAQKRIILSSIKEAVAYLDKDYKIIWINEATKKMFDCNSEEVIGEPCFKVFHTDSEHYQKCQSYNFANLENDTLIDSFSYNDKELLVSTNAIKDENNNITHYVKTFSDISEMKKFENTLREAYERAKTANKAKSTFLSTITHEIRTPLNAIIGFSDLLQYEEMTTKSGSYASSINTAAKGLLSLINNVLDFSRLEAKKLKINTSSVVISELMNEMKLIFSNKAKSKELNLDFIISSNIPSLILDKDRLRQVIINIIGNAIKFTHKGGVTVETTVQSITKDNHNTYDLIISISDTGIGISKQEQQRIFNSFEQIENSSNRKYEGSGLGLSISKLLIELMNGEIFLSSTTSKGSKFTVVLHNLIAGEPIQTSEQNNSKILIEFEPANILVISRQPEQLNVIANILDRLQLNRNCVYSTDEAINELNKNNYDLIINSITQSQQDAESLPQQIRKLKKYKDTPLIAFSSYSEPAEHFNTSLYSETMVVPITLLDFTAIMEKYLIRKENITSKKILPEEETEIIISQETKNAVYDKFKDKFSSLQHGLILEDARKIAKEFIDFAEESGNNNLLIIAKKLDQYIATFKLPDIMNTINLFLNSRDNDDETT